MNTEVGLYWMQEALKALVVLAGPILAIALVVGLMIALFQAVTSIQEMTLAYVPKMVAAVALLFFIFDFMLQFSIDFMVRIFSFISTINTL